jgi:signal transduction histidine kinase
LNRSSPVLFTDLENDYQYLPNDTTFPEGQGTEFWIRLLHEPWDKEMLLRLHNQLTRILAPTFVMNPPFDIGFYAPEFQMEYEKTKPQPIETLATLHITIPFDKIHQKQGFLTFHKETETFDIQYIEPKDFGLIRMEFYYFDSDAQKAFKSKYKNTSNYIEGVKIYRDGLICTPFAEYESALDKRRDILGIDTRRSQWDILKINTREVIGIVDITKEQNPNIIDTTNRQDFLDNEAYQQLKKFIRKQLDVLAAYKALKRTQQKQRIANSLVKAPQEMDEVTIQLQQIMNQHPTLSSDIQKVMAKMEQVKASVKAGIKEQKATEKEFLQKQELYLSLMTIQDYANHLAHGLRFYLAPLKHIAEFFFNNYPNLEYEQQFKDDSKKMFGLTEKMSHLINFMLNYTDKGKKESFFIKNLLEELDEAYEAIFEQEQIQFKILMEMEIELKGNRKFLEDVFSNLISNAIKALKEVDDKVIQCQCYTEDKKIYILFADNGCGVDKSVEKSMFEMFVTTTAEQGGSGFGLFIAKQRMNALKGNIELVKSVFAPRGATFKLSLPLKPN